MRNQFFQTDRGPHQLLMQQSISLRISYILPMLFFFFLNINNLECSAREAVHGPYIMRRRTATNLKLAGLFVPVVPSAILVEQKEIHIFDLKMLYFPQ